MKRASSKSAAVFKAVAYIVFLLLLCEASARAYLRIKDGIPFFASAGRHIYRYYPELEYVDREKKRVGRADLEVLILGASVMHNPNYDVSVPIQGILQSAPPLKGKKVRVYNIAVSAQTSRDSYFKYLLLSRKYHFDAVLVYHAINDVRANNCPPEIFRRDYSHYAWYDEVNFYFRWERAFRAGTYLPYFAHIAARRLSDRVSGRTYMPRTEPRPEWIRYGGDIKTASPFRHNLEGIASIAAAKNETVILSTFAYYLPRVESLDEWRKNRKGRHAFAAPIQLWGAPGNVLKGIRVHNTQIRRIAAARANVALLDEQKLMPKKDEYYIDVCHFSDAGVRLFAWHAARAILAATANK